MNNISYHSIELNKTPTIQKKQIIQDWLNENAFPFHHWTLK